MKTSRLMTIGKGLRTVMAALLAWQGSAYEGRAQSLAAYQYNDATQLWRLTDNAAGLALDSSKNRGYAAFSATYRDGDYRRVQEGGRRNQLQFSTERYQAVGKYLVGYGRFDFSMDRTQDRAWADVMRPYDSDPFFSGSSIRGKYDLQDFDMTAAIGTNGQALGRLLLGARLDYQVADLSRLRDPRSRSQLLKYRVGPSACYVVDQHHTVGLAPYYQRRKEKIPSMTTVQEDPNIGYYLMSGLEQASGTVGGYKGYSREWVDHRLGAELSYDYRSAEQHSLLTLGMERGEENIYENYKREPGRYVDYTYSLGLRNRFYETATRYHQLDVGIDYEQAFADEYRQILVQEKDGKTGLTSYHYDTQIVFKKRHQLQRFHADLRYRIHFARQRQEQGYAGLRVDMNDSQQKHLLPTSQMGHGGTSIMAEGGLALGQRLWVEALAGGYVAQEAQLDLGDASTDYARQVLMPDMDYYKANYWRGRVKLTYEFPLTIKGSQTRWFVSAYGDYLRTNRSLDGRSVGLSIGIFD